MIGHTEHKIPSRQAYLIAIQQEMAGKPIYGGPFDFHGDLFFDGIEGEGELGVVGRFRRAIARDAKHSCATAPYVRKIGIIQSLRSVYDGGRQIVDGTR